MKLKLKNIGNFINAEVELNKITIFTGKNATGKTTILNSIHFLSSINSNSFKFFLNQYYKKELTSVVYKWFGLERFDDLDLYPYEDFEEDIEQFEIEERIKTSMDHILYLVHGFNFSKGIVVFKELIDFLLLKFEDVNIYKIHKEMDDIIKIFFTEHNIKSSFLDFLYKDKVVKNGHDIGFVPFTVKVGELSGSVSLTKDNEEISITLANQGKSKNFVFDEIEKFNFDHLWNTNSFSTSDVSNLRVFIKENNDFEGITQNKKISNILDNINSLVRENGIGIHTNQLSKGMRTFDIIRKIRYSLFKNGGFLIFDDEAGNLDPENQLKLAELLVSLVKHTNINIVLSSQSGYFLEAMELYARLENMNEDINFYLTSKDSKSFKVENVNDDLGKMYSHFLSPYEKFDELRQLINSK